METKTENAAGPSAPASGSACFVCGLPLSVHEQCPKCGYTHCDCAFHMDHRLCGQPNPPAPVREVTDGAPPKITYQPQHLWSDGEFDPSWVGIGEPTISKQVIRSRLALFLSIHPDDKVRVLKIVSSAEVIDAAEFMPNTKTSDA